MQRKQEFSLRLQAGMVIRHPCRIGGGSDLSVMVTWLKRVKTVTLLQVRGKIWHTKLNGINHIIKSQTEAKKWNSLKNQLNTQGHRSPHQYNTLVQQTIRIKQGRMNHQ